MSKKAVRRNAWEDTPLGPVSDWPGQLRVLVEAHATSTVPTCLFWGAENVIIPNAAWEREWAGVAGPQAGLPAAALSVALHRACEAARDGEAAGALAEVLAPLMWQSFVDRPFAALSDVPIRDEAGRVQGLLVQLGLATSAPSLKRRAGDAQARTSFMLRLSDALRLHDDADAVQALGTKMLAEELDVDRASFSEVDLVEGKARERLEYLRDPAAPAHVVDHDLADFGPEIRCLCNGLPLVIHDILDAAGETSDPVAAEVARHAHAPFRAQLTVPVLRSGKLVSVITVRRDRPHRWSVAEIATAQEAGTRIWEAIERAKAESEVQDRERRLRSLVSATSHTVYRMSADFRTLYELDGQGFLDDTVGPCENWLSHYVHPDEQCEVMALAQRAVETRTVYEHETRVRRADGTFARAWTRAVPILDATGQIVEWFGAATDVRVRFKMV